MLTTLQMTGRDVNRSTCFSAAVQRVVLHPFVFIHLVSSLQTASLHSVLRPAHLHTGNISEPSVCVIKYQETVRSQVSQSLSLCSSILCNIL